VSVSTACSSPGRVVSTSSTPAKVEWKRARYDQGFLGGAALALGYFAWFVARAMAFGHRDGREHFFTAQAISMLHGSFAVPRQVLSIGPAPNGDECFVIKGHCLGYFGIAPSAFRIPLLVLTGSRSYRTFPEQPFFLLAFGVLAGGIWWLTRQLVASWGQQAPAPLVGGLGFALGLGALAASPILFLASLPLMYQESLLWGLGFACLGLASALSIWLAGTSKVKVATLLFADLLAMSSQPTLGATALVLTVLLGVGLGWPGRFPKGWAPRAACGNLALAALLIGGALGAFLSAPIVSYAKFGSLSPPYRDNVVLQGNPSRMAKYLHSGDLNLGVIPTKMFDALRPDRLAVSVHHPYFSMDEPPKVPTPIWPATAADLDWFANASISATVPFFAVAATIGVIALLRRRQVATARPATFAALLSALAALLVCLAYPGQTYRYQVFWLPILFLCAVVGLAVLAGGFHRFHAWGIAVVAVLALLLALQLTEQTALAIGNGITQGTATFAACPSANDPFGELGELFCPVP